MHWSTNSSRHASITGYLHPGYAESLKEFGAPRVLPRCGGWILERPIPGSPHRDAMGCYPLFACQNWSRLHLDLEELGRELVSVMLVTDPFGAYEADYLRQCFGDVFLPFKEHFVIDLHQPMDTFVSQHHRRNARKALKVLCVERCEDPISHLDEWNGLYADLTQRHNITGIRAFSDSTFAKQMSVPGIVVLCAVCEGITVSMLLWYVQGDVGYYHLGASNSLGYKLGASFALFWFAIDYFAINGLRWLSLGGGSGAKGDSADGLSRFKRGWSTGTRPVYFCGSILDREKYAELANASGIADSTYFPVYRAGEFA